MGINKKTDPEKRRQDNLNYIKRKDQKGLKPYYRYVTRKEKECLDTYLQELRNSCIFLPDQNVV